jgi:hypothetical protein
MSNMNIKDAMRLRTLEKVPLTDLRDLGFNLALVELLDENKGYTTANLEQIAAVLGRTRRAIPVERSEVIDGLWTYEKGDRLRESIYRPILTDAN